MWLLFKLIEKTSSGYRYAYSRENHSLDGIAFFDTGTKRATVEKPCLQDEGREIALRNVLEALRNVSERDFPEETRVIFG